MECTPGWRDKQGSLCVCQTPTVVVKFVFPVSAFYFFFFFAPHRLPRHLLPFPSSSSSSPSRLLRSVWAEQAVSGAFASEQGNAVGDERWSFGGASGNASCLQFEEQFLFRTCRHANQLLSGLSRSTIWERVLFLTNIRSFEVLLMGTCEFLGADDCGKNRGFSLFWMSEWMIK